MRSNKEFCPPCNADLQGGPIPKQLQKAYGATHFTRKIGSVSIKPKCGCIRLRSFFFIKS